MFFFSRCNVRVYLLVNTRYGFEYRNANLNSNYSFFHFVSVSNIFVFISEFKLKCVFEFDFIQIHPSIFSISSKPARTPSATTPADLTSPPPHPRGILAGRGRLQVSPRLPTPYLAGRDRLPMPATTPTPPLPGPAPAWICGGGQEPRPTSARSKVCTSAPTSPHSSPSSSSSEQGENECEGSLDGGTRLSSWCVLSTHARRSDIFFLSPTHHGKRDLTICHFYGWHFFVCQFYVGSYIFAIVK